ncbi:DNA repair and recombination protein RAD52 [Cyberlindnera fabianii]|uniref:DNA repair and recombination protein RAD52 n=1 Tax=Cyberlindnera fabianii TaxID=36022 RepID=A0A1V2LC16_CYBFA|nr:DNA repair and recombination protein RAD52 [Cyberlindnera fabianii]
MNQLNNGSFKGATAVKTEQYQPDEVNSIQSKLDKQLGPEFVSTRPGAGGVSVSYIEGWKAINLANQVFGFNGWFSEVKTINVDYLDDRNGKYSVGLSIVVRVTLKDGTYHEDIGYGSLDNGRTKAMAFEKAKKEAMTDGLKRALRCFGNAMGNCLYDKEYLSKISGVKCAPADFDEANLMRYTDAPTRTSTIPGAPGMASIPATTSHHDYGSATVHQKTTEQTNHKHAHSHRNPIYPPPTPQSNTPQTAAVPAKRPINQSPARPPTKRQLMDDNFDDSLTFSDDLNPESEDLNDDLMNELIDGKQSKMTVHPGNGEQEHNESTETIQPGAGTNETRSAEPQTVNHASEPVGFFKSRVALELQNQSPTVSNNDVFNPQFISPSIRRSVDPTKSTPIKRSDVQSKAALRYDNPKMIQNRQVGRPRYPPPKSLTSSQTNSENVAPSNTPAAGK